MLRTTDGDVCTDGDVSSVGFASRLAIAAAAKMMTTAEAAMIRPWTHRVRRGTGAVGEAIAVPPPGFGPQCPIRIVADPLLTGNPSSGRSSFRPGGGI